MGNRLCQWVEWPTHMPPTRLYLAPCASPYPQRNFERTMQRGVERSEYDEWVSEDYGDIAYVWGLSSGLESTWEKIEAGDYFLFYFGNLEYRYGARVVGKGRYPEWSEELWPAPDQSSTDAPAKKFELLVFFEPPFRVSLDSPKVQEYAGYKRDFPQNFQPLNDQGVANIEAEHGSVVSFLDAHRAVYRGSPPGDIEHPLLSHVQTLGEAGTVWRVSNSPDHWLTAIRYGAIGFIEDDRQAWTAINEGDVVLFHTDVRPSDPELDSQADGIIGAGIVGGRCEKTEPWWWDEHRHDVDYQLVVAFHRVFVSGDITRIDYATRITEKTTAERNAELRALTRGLLSTVHADEICRSETGRRFPQKSPHEAFETGAGEDDHGQPIALMEAMAPALVEIPAVNVHDQFTGRLTADVFEGLYFPDETGAEIAAQLTAVLRAGKHVILTGPPGTGKTEVARQTCRALSEAYPYLYSGFQITTATADWSTYDTVGGYMPGEQDDDGGLSFTPGIVLNRFKSRQTGVQTNEPLVIDELNRADIDKAFGQLFTLLSGQSVQLPYTVDGNEVELLSASSDTVVLDPHQYVVPRSWRIFATMNTYDKTSLYEMSYAFMRRFAFIRITAPDLPTDERELIDLMEQYAAQWDDIDATEKELNAVGRVWRETNREVDERAIGPAIVRDMLAYLSQHDTHDLSKPLTEAVIAFIFPQLEGVPRRAQILRNIRNVETIDVDLLERAAQDMLQETIAEINE